MANSSMNGQKCTNSNNSKQSASASESESLSECCETQRNL